MAWFDGTTDFEKDEFEEQFPITITEDLRANAERTQIALINRFQVGSKLYEISDPHLENGVYHNKIFYHTFIGEDAYKAKEAICNFELYGYGKGEYEVSLFRMEEDRLYLYSYGELHTEYSLPSKISDSCKEMFGEGLFFLPLKIYAFSCPVCGAKTLRYRGMFEICKFCGWEDEGVDGDDEEPGFGPNGDFTIRQYREAYKRKMKKIDNFMSMFTDMAKYRVSMTQNDNCPYDDEDAIILAEQIWTMDDGVEIQFLLRRDSGYDYIDVAVNKGNFADKTGDDYVAYLKSKGMSTTTGTEEETGKWEFCGKVEHNEMFVVQFLFEENG